MYVTGQTERTIVEIVTNGVETMDDHRNHNIFIENSEPKTKLGGCKRKKEGGSNEKT